MLQLRCLFMASMFRILNRACGQAIFSDVTAVLRNTSTCLFAVLCAQILSRLSPLVRAVALVAPTQTSLRWHIFLRFLPWTYTTYAMPNSNMCMPRLCSIKAPLYSLQRLPALDHFDLFEMPVRVSRPGTNKALPMA